MTTVVINTANALGDFVLSWPILRALQGTTVLVCPAEKAALASDVLSIPSLPVHTPPWNDIFRGTPAGVGMGMDRVISIGALTESCRAALLAGAPGIELIETPAPLDRVRTLEWASRLGKPTPPCRGGNAAGPVTLHAGSGGRGKRWPLDRWIALSEVLRTRAVTLVAGEVEFEQWCSIDRDTFTRSGGEFVTSLAALRRRLESSRLVVAADCGPGHLAAALGVPTLSLFGPTDAARWAPIGPASRVVAPPTPRPMEWLSVEEAAASVGSHDDANAR